MIQGKWFEPGADLSGGVLSIRDAVFSRGGDALDAVSWNVLVYEDGTPAAAGRIWWEDGLYRLGEIGVLEERRGRRLGDLVLRLLLFKAQSHAAREVRLVSPRDTVGFFSRLGLRPLSPDADPVEMAVMGSDINLDSCASCAKQNCPNRK